MREGYIRYISASGGMAYTTDLRRPSGLIGEQHSFLRPKSVALTGLRVQLPPGRPRTTVLTSYVLYKHSRSELWAVGLRRIGTAGGLR